MEGNRQEREDAELEKEATFGFFLELNPPNLGIYRTEVDRTSLVGLTQP